MADFQGFEAADFDAFAEKKWSSNAFNRERLEVKLKLTALGKVLADLLGKGLGDQEMGISEERPSIFNQHRVRHLTLFFYRNQDSRRALGAILDKAKSIADNVLDPAPHHKHLVIGIRILVSGLEAGLYLHKDAWVDWKNAIGRCQAAGETERFSGILAELSPDIRYAHGLRIEPNSTPVCEVPGEQVLAGFASADPWSLFGKAFDRGDPALSDADLVPLLTGLFETLLPLRSFVAWDRENDFHDMKAAIKEHKEKSQRRISTLDVGEKVRITKGIASGRVGVVDAVEKRGVVKVRIGLMVLTVNMDELAQP